MATAFCVGLPDGVRLSARAYLGALRLAMANPTASFKQSFNDPTGWMGGHTGASIVAEWRAMLAGRWAARFAAAGGKGNRARKRAEALRCCKWCGTRCGKDFCGPECRHDYHN